MSDLNFPTSPALNDTYSFNGKTWVWNGQGWQLQNQGAINGIIIGNSTPAAGTFTTLSATGNITGNYFLGNGSQLSGIITTVDANTLTGNTLSSNIVNSSLTSTGTLGSLSVTGNITGGNVLTGGLLSATGNITGGNILGGANVNATTHTGTTVSVTANVTGGNLLTGGLISATGNITGNYFIGNGSQLTGVIASSGAGNLWVVGRIATFYVPIISGILTIVGRSGNISVAINS